MFLNVLLNNFNLFLLEAQVLAQQISSFHSVMFNPNNSKLLVTAHSEEGIALWDTRKPKTYVLSINSRFYC